MNSQYHNDRLIELLEKVVERQNLQTLLMVKIVDIMSTDRDVQFDIKSFNNGYRAMRDFNESNLNLDNKTLGNNE